MADTQVQRNDAAMDNMAEEGRGTDSVMAHLTNGEIVIPLPLAQNKRFVEMLTMHFELIGEDIEEFTVGNAKQKINPETGHPEFLSLKSAVKAVTAPVKAVASAVSTVASSVASATKTVVNTAGNVIKDVVTLDPKALVNDTVQGAKTANGQVISGARDATGQIVQGAVKTLAYSMDAIGILPKVPPVQGPADSSPSTVAQGDGANQRQQAVTDVQAAAGGGASTLTPRTVAGPDSDYKLDKSAVLGI